jgi:tripartite-type tricarboxylate transporter receptor subunit TctC
MNTISTAGGTTRRATLAALAAAGLVPLAGTARAQGTYPNHAIRVIVPFPPGGGTDVVARMFATRMGNAIGQPMVIDNRGGATGIIGTTQAAQATPDGYTVLIGSLSSHVLAPLTAETKASDPVKDFIPIAILAYHPMVLVAHEGVKANNLKEFIALGQKAEPPLFYGSIGAGSLFHFASAEFVHLTGMKAKHIPYKGAAPAMTDLLGGQTQFMFDTIQSSLPQIQKGGLKAFAVTGPTRNPLLPNVPTLAESGLGNFDVVSWVGLFAPAHTPPEVVNRLAAEAGKLTRDKEFVDQASKTGTDVPQGTPEAFRAIVVKDQAKYTELFKRLDLAAT